MRTLMQAAVFLTTARILGVKFYGAYISVLALAGILGNLGGLGSQALMVRDVSRKHSNFSIAWGRTLSAITVSGPILFFIYLNLSYFILPATIPLHIIVLIGLSEIIFSPISFSVIAAYQGYEHVWRASRLVLVPVLPRLTGALILISLNYVFKPLNCLSIWVVIYTLASFLAAVYGLHLVHQELGAAKRPTWKDLRNTVSKGLSFSFSRFAIKIFSDIDKTMLAYLATLGVAGAYSAAYRVTDFAMVPIRSLILAAMPRFFRAGENSVRGVFIFGYRILPIPLIYCLLAGIALFYLSSLIPVFLGPSYYDAINVMKWLAWLPLVSMPRFLLQTILLGGDRQNAAVIILWSGTFINVGLNFLLIPPQGWLGAVLATYIAEIAMALAMLSVGLYPLLEWQGRVKHFVSPDREGSEN